MFRLETQRDIRRLRALRRHRRCLLPHHRPSPSPPPPPAPPPFPIPPTPHFISAQPLPPPPLRHHGCRLRPLRRRSPPFRSLALLLPPFRHRPYRAPLLLGPRLLPLQAVRARRYPPNPPLRRPPPPHLPPCLPPRHRRRHVLCLARHRAVPHAGRPRHQRLRPRRHVRLLPLQQRRLAMAPAVEAGRHGPPDRPVRLQLPHLRHLPLVPLRRRRVRRDARLAFQCRLQRLAPGPLR
ncbi:hypothetical protein Cni_G09844 [Canna indica]|uniref:Uncharacterized protein n=1 Tax=Canna indica TaxID=4628 RepID=A0AAQ3K526_9LILI|nr:hypothetical protein Cni_G09844 [Canna indica]